MTATRAIFSSTIAPGESSVSNLTMNGDDFSKKQTGPDSRLAMNISKIPGVQFGRPTRTVSSPDGEVTAIVMSDNAVDIHEGVSRNPKYNCPDHIYAWEPTIAWTSSTVGTDVPSKINARFQEYSQNFYFLYTHMLVKLVCKTPLDRSDRFLINWSDIQGAATDQDGVSFEWAPIEQNVIYILLPYCDESPLVDTAITADGQDKVPYFGSLNIKQIASNSGVVQINGYSCPTGTQFANLKPKALGSTPTGKVVSQYTLAAGNSFPVVAGTYQVAVQNASTYPFSVTIGATQVVAANSTGLIVEDITVPADTTINMDNGNCEVLLIGDSSAFPPFAEEQIELDNSTKLTEQPPVSDQVGHQPDTAPSRLPSVVYGVNKTESVRETNQFYHLGTASIDTSSPVQVTLSAPKELLVNFGRHALWTEYPQFKVVATQTIQNPGRYRVTQVPQYLSLEPSESELFQLPGIEWDPKDGDLNLNPYWDRADPAFVLDPAQTLEQNFASFIPRIYLQKINSYGNAVPVNVFGRVNHSSYHAVRPIPSTFYAEEQGCWSTSDSEEEQEEKQYCCKLKCKETPRIQFDGKACDICRAYSFCRCACYSWVKENIEKHNFVVPPYVREGDEGLLIVNEGQIYGGNRDAIVASYAYVHKYKARYHTKFFRAWCFDCPDARKLIIEKLNYDVRRYDLELMGLQEKHNLHHHNALKNVVWPLDPPEEQVNPPSPKEHKNLKKKLVAVASVVGKISFLAASVATGADVDAIPDSGYPEEQIDDGTTESPPNAVEHTQQPGNQFQGQLGSLQKDEGAIELARSMAYVDSFRLAVTTADPSPAVSVALDANALGPYVRQEARRHKAWRGNLRYKVLVNTPRTIAGPLTVAHVDENFATQPDAYELRQYPHQISMDNTPVELECGWRKPTPWVNRSDNNGYLYITFNGSAFTSSTEVVVTLYVDASGVEFSRATPLGTLPPRTYYMVPGRRQLPRCEVSPSAIRASVAHLGMSTEDVDQIVHAGLFMKGGFLECPTCRTRLGFWEEGDVPLNEHMRHSGGKHGCPLALRQSRTSSPWRPLSLDGIKRLNAAVNGSYDDTW